MPDEIVFHPSLFDQPTPDAHARRSDPNSSQRTVASLGRDGSIKALIWEQFLIADRENYALNDTDLTLLLEQRTGRRWQRNVVARSRGLMVHDGWLLGVGERLYQGRMIEHYVIHPDLPSSLRHP